MQILADQYWPLAATEELSEFCYLFYCNLETKVMQFLEFKCLNSHISWGWSFLILNIVWEFRRLHSKFTGQSAALQNLLRPLQNVKCGAQATMRGEA